VTDGRTVFRVADSSRRGLVSFEEFVVFETRESYFELVVLKLIAKMQCSNESATS
jgi:hypothetical protein